MIAPPDKTVKPLRPQGNFGVQITVVINGTDKTLWLDGITTAQADIFRTPSDLRLDIPVGQMLNSLLQDTPLAGDLPEVVRSAQVDRLELRKLEGKSNFSFGLEISVAYDDSEVRLWLILEKITVNNKTKYEFALKIRLGDPLIPSIEIDIELDTNGFFAHLEQTHNPKSFNMAPLGRVLSPELEELMGKIEITPLEMAISSYKSSDDSNKLTNINQPNQKNTRSYVLAFRLQGDVSLSQLPFVGEKLPKTAEIGIKDLALVWCSAAIAEDENARQYFIEAYNNANKSDSSLTNDNLTESNLITIEALSSSGLFSASLQIPSVESQQLSLPFTPSSQSAPPSSSSSTPTQPISTKPSTITSSDDATKWFEVNKNVGPLSLKRMGLKYQDKRVWFLFDTSLSAGAVTLIVDGLGAGIDPFELLGGRFNPIFTLRGLGLTIKGPAEVSGAFLRERISDPRGDYDEFSGVVLIKTEALTVSGMGSYADPPWGDPSFFAYAFLDKTIGGPPFFFVTGLALGIAVNRNLDLPPIDQVSQFPLVRLALGEPLTPPGSSLPAIRNTGGDSDLAKLLQVQQAMKPYTRRNPGQVVLAIGVRFTTFKLLNSFALLVVSFSKPFKLDLLISSRLQIPALTPGSKSVPPIAQVGIDLRGTWIPEEGYLSIEGRITEGSWFLDSACRLSGGAAFTSWTKGDHNGDFVLTVGGYHPKFPVPAHYPKVPRLAFNFTRGPIEIKGDAYFAMTPSALMAGGNLSATFSQGNIQAWFKCGADFLIAWEPFNYEATMYVEVGASWRTIFGRVRGSVGAKLQLWGPDLAGITTVDLKIFKFDVKFGNQDRNPPKPIDAKTFRERFLPANEDLISIGVSKGLVRSGKNEDGSPLYVVNPADFSLAIESVIPKPDGEKIGIAPMGKIPLKMSNLLTIRVNNKEINLPGSQSSNNDQAFYAEKIEKPVPSALWGPAPEDGIVQSPDFNTTDTVIEAIVGYTIKPKNTPKSPESPSYNIQIFDLNPDPYQQQPSPSWNINNDRFKEDDSTDESKVKSIFNKQDNDFDKHLLEALTGEDKRDFVSEVLLSTDWLADLQELPHIVTLETVVL